jgi:CHAT domain-containing protein
MLKPRNVLALSILLTFFSQLCVFNPVVAFSAQNPSAQTAAADFAKKLLDAPDDAARERALSEASPSLVSADLVNALLSIGSALQNEGKYVEALHSYVSGEFVAVRIGFKEGQAKAIFQQGEIYSDNKQDEKAIKLYEKALELIKNIDQKTSKENQANLDERVGLYYYKVLVKYKRSSEWFEMASRKYELIGDETSLQRVLNLLGETYKYQGRYVDARNLFQDLLKKCEKSNTALLPEVLHNLGIVSSDIGDYRGAIGYFERSYSLIPSDDLTNLAYSLVHKGSAYRFQGNYDQALKCYRRALEIRREKKDEIGCAYALQLIGSILLETKNLIDAKKCFIQSKIILENKESIKYKIALAGTLYYLGRLCLIERDPESAHDFFQKAYDLEKLLDDKYKVAIDMSNLALSLQMLGNFGKAQEYAKQSVMIQTEFGTPYGIWCAKSILGEICRLQGRADEARQVFEEAISVIENGRTQVAGGAPEQRQYFEDKARAYHGLMSLLQMAGKTDAAFACAEQFKARVLQDVLQSGRISVTHAMTVGEREEEERLRTVLTSVNARLKAGKNERTDARLTRELEEKLRQAQLEHEAFRIKLYAAHPELKTQRGEREPITFDQLATLVPNAETALIEYVVTDNETCVFVVTGEDVKQTGNGKTSPSVSAHRISIEKDRLEQRVRTFHNKISSHDLNIDEAAQDLYKLLLKPVDDRLNGRTKFIIVPDGPLWKLPFNALKPASKRFLIEDAEISYAPSLTALYEMRRLHDRSVGEKPLDVLAFGDPLQSLPHGKASRQGKLISESRLPDAKQEAKTIANLFRPRGRALIGEQADENNFRKLSGSARILHIATHGVVDNVSPMYSHVLLAEGDANHDGRLEVWEIADMDINADLVTLSACETAGGKFSQGEGMIGLSWAFFIAGCRSTLVSQWKVESQGTAELMIEFYRRYSKRTGDTEMSKTEALRSASLKMLKSREYAHPFYWAGFALIGDER